MRDFQLLGPVEGIVTGPDVVNISTVVWAVDEDNPAWARVRADAIRAALHRGQDYASAPLARMSRRNVGSMNSS